LSLKIAKSNFNFIEANFSDIISEIRESANGIHDPFHIHSGDDERHHNEKFRELNDILEFIRLRQLSMRR
jgi:hypothetical protein